MVCLADLLRNESLQLRLATTSGDVERRARWAHVCELDDPSAWLEGGEILLATGMALVGRDDEALRAYVRQLATRQAALGLGTGLFLDELPDALVDEAERLCFPVFEIPIPIPFTAITEAFFTALAREQYVALERAVTSQERLTARVLIGGGSDELLEELAAIVGGWAILFDGAGRVIGSRPELPADHVGRVWGRLARAVVGVPTGRGTFTVPGSYVHASSVRAGDRINGYLAVGTSDRMPNTDRVVITQAVTLLSLQLDKLHAVLAAEERLKGGALDALLGGQLGSGELRAQLGRFGLGPDEPLAVVVASAIDTTVVGEDVVGRALEEALRTFGARSIVAVRDGTAVAVVAAETLGDLEGLQATVVARLGRPGAVRIGASRPVGAGELARGSAEARRALRVAELEDLAIASHADLGSYRLLLAEDSSGELASFAAALLTPLEDYDRERDGALVASLESFLEHHGVWEASARSLGIHRHTLRYRMERVEDLTGRSLASPQARVELWLALRARRLGVG